MKVKVERKPTVIPSYVPGKPNDLPFFLEKKPYQGATGRIYPVPFIDSISNTRQEKTYDLIKLENDYIEVELLPELGGKIHGATQKSNNYEFIYKNIVIKPAMIGIAGPWVSGGVERTALSRSGWGRRSLSTACAAVSESRFTRTAL